MSKLRVNAFGISIDGHGAGPGQDLANPMGVGGMALHQWVLGTKTFQTMAADFAGSLIGDKAGREGVDDDFAARGFENLGTWIMGRNMFGPVRGPWPGRTSPRRHRYGEPRLHVYGARLHGPRHPCGADEVG